MLTLVCGKFCHFLLLESWLTQRSNKFDKDFLGCTTAACGALVPPPGIELAPPELDAPSLNHWTTREAPELDFKGAGDPHQIINRLA